MMSRASARAIKDLHERFHPSGSPSAAWNHAPADNKVDHTEESSRELYKNPTTGRNTKLGRKVEKPAEPKSGGPSGQKERAKHDKRHANK
jgi:hypothetical protein